MIRVLSINEDNITSINFYHEFKFLIVGTHSGQLAFFETDTGKLHGCSLASRYAEEVTSITLMDDIPFLITTTSSGKINFIATPPLLYKFTVVDSFLNFDSEDTGETLGNKKN